MPGNGILLLPPQGPSQGSGWRPSRLPLGQAPTPLVSIIWHGFGPAGTSDGEIRIPEPVRPAGKGMSKCLLGDGVGPSPRAAPGVQERGPFSGWPGVGEFRQNGSFCLGTRTISEWRFFPRPWRGRPAPRSWSPLHRGLHISVDYASSLPQAGSSRLPLATPSHPGPAHGGSL